MIGVWLAQPALALAVSWLRGTRPQRRLADAGPLLLLWGAGLAGSALLLVWPMSARTGNLSLGVVLALSAMAGLAVIALWRSWPLWHAMEREGGSLSAHWRALGQRDLHAWRGLGAALWLALIVAGALLLAWPGVLAPPLRGWVAGLYALALPLLHLGLQRIPAADALPIVEMKPAVRKAEAPPPTTEANASAASEDIDLQAALFEAARGGRVERALELLEAGADPHALPPASARDQRSLGVLAAVLPDLRLLRALIARGVDLNLAHASVTPLLAATRDSWHGRPDAVTTLLANGADPRAADSEGNTPLHHAARSSDPGVAALLRDAAAEVDALNHEGLTPLGVACMVGNWRLAKFLLERGASPQPADGRPVLLAAAATEEDDPAGVQLLLKHKARADARDAAGRSALHEAAWAGHVDIIDTLLAAGADVQGCDAAGRTPWLEAARGNRAAAAEALVKAGARADDIDTNGRNALMLACAGESETGVVAPALVRYLLEHGVDPDQADREGRRAVDVAAEAGRWTIVSALDPDYPLPAAVADDEASQAPADRAPIALLREALEAGRDEELPRWAALCSREELGQLLHETGIAISPARLERVLALGADAESRDAHGDGLAFALMVQGLPALPALRRLLQRGASPAGAGGLSRWLATLAHRGEGGVEAETLALEMLERGADPFAKSAAGDPPLSLSVRLGMERLLERVLDIGVNREARDSRGMTALHLAVALGNADLVRRLILRGASPEARAADGQTPLGVALSSGRRDLADWLDWRGWALPKRALRAADLPAAAMSGDVDAVRRLLELGFAVDAVDAQGCTALLRAAGGGHRAIVDFLLARGADSQHAANTGATPLSAAVSMHQLEIVDILLTAGAQIEHRLPNGVTVLMLAAALGFPDVAARLLNAGADPHASDVQGLTPLHCAAMFGFLARDRARLVALFDTLLLAGSEPERVAAGAVTPLLLLLGARAEPGTACHEEVLMAALERLLDEGVSLDAQDPRGFGSLHLAALHGLPQVAARLLRAGADPDLRDALNRSPREIAVMRGFVDIAGLFAPASLASGASMARFLREPKV
nr:ankyrin repeat domain-containing protein [Pseudoxanthomonas kalamensis]